MLEEQPRVCIQCKSVIPACRKVPNLDFFVTGSLPLTPEQEALLGTQSLLVDIAYCKPKNQSPYQTQYNFAIPVHDVFGADIGHLYATPLDEVQALVDIFESLDP